MFDETYGDGEEKGQHKDNDYCNETQWAKKLLQDIKHSMLMD